jgi:hypothetical protein
MIRLLALLEGKQKTTDFSAISKKTGRLVYFDTKDNMDAAVKDGTHDTPKIKGKDVETPKSSDLFKGDYEKERGGTIDKNNKPSDKLVNAIQTQSIGTQSITLYRKNKNGKLVNDVQFSQTDMTADIIKQVANDEGIDLNALNKLDSSTKIKDEDGRKNPIHDIMRGLIFKNLETKQYAPDGIAPDERLYKIYSDRKNKIAKIIKKLTDPSEAEKQVAKNAAKAERDKTNLYDKDGVKDVTNILVSLGNKNGGFDNYEPQSSEIAKVANKFKIDVNRILKHPQAYCNLVGCPSEKELKKDGYKSMRDYVLSKLGHTAYFGTTNDVDSMYNLADLQLAYPLEYKNLSDGEWNKQIEEERKNPTTVSGALRKFNQDEFTENKDTESISDNNAKLQSKWVSKQSKKGSDYTSNMMAYQSMISKSALGEIDNLLKSDPPPPIKAKALYRGMALKRSDYSKFIKSFEEGSNIDLPISSFSFDSGVATGFADNVANDNALISKENNQAVVIKVVNKKNQFNGFAMNSNIGNTNRVKTSEFDSDFSNWSFQHEVLLPSNNKYKVVKVERKEMKNGRSFTTILLEQTELKKEIKLKELIDSQETDFLKKHLQYPNRLSLLYKKEKK